MSWDAPQERVYRLVREYVAAWNSHDVDRLICLFVEDGSYGEFGLGRVMLGQEEIRRHLIATFAALPDLIVAATGEPLSRGERVYWKWLLMGTHRGEFAGVAPTGKRFELRGFSALLTSGDRIVRASDCFDVASIVRQVAPGCQRRSSHGNGLADSGRTGPDPWLGMVADEDNIGYGE
jgi:steroid delta-isomerase-like uncharacterized protein